MFDMLSPVLDTDARIILDMDGVDDLPTLFLNPSIGRIVKERGVSAMSRFTFRNISRNQIERLMTYVDKFRIYDR